MNDAIIVAIVSSITTIIGVVYSNKENKNLILYRIQQLEDKVSKHNNLVERTYKLEAEIQSLLREREDE